MVPSDEKKPHPDAQSDVEHDAPSATAGGVFSANDNGTS